MVVAGMCSSAPILACCAPKVISYYAYELELHPVTVLASNPLEVHTTPGTPQVLVSMAGYNISHVPFRWFSMTICFHGYVYQGSSRKPDIFEKMTKVVQLESEGLLEVSEWPIPEHVLSMDSSCI